MALIGRLHPLLIHFPIALVIAAAAAEAVAMLTRDRIWHTGAVGNLRAAAAFAVLAAVAGWRLASQPGMEPSLLLEWHRVADRGGMFRWEAEMDEAQVRMLVQYWANLDSLTDEHLDRLGITWSPPDAKEFFDAVAVGVASAFEVNGGREPFSEMLASQAEPA